MFRLNFRKKRYDELDLTSQFILYYLKKYKYLDSTEIAILINKQLKKPVRTNTIRKKLFKLISLGYVKSKFEEKLGKTIYYLSD